MKRQDRAATLPAATGVPERAHHAVLMVLGAVVVLAHLVGTLWAPGWMWGANAYAFLPGFVLPVALLAVSAAFLVLWRSTSVPLVRLPAISRVSVAWAAVAAFAAFWLARSRQLLLGDGIPLVANLPYETTLHAREPLVSLIHQRTFAIAAWSAPGRDPHDLARDAVALDSAIAGVLFLLVAVGLARAILRGPDGIAGASHPWLVGLLLAQGYAALFFGYVENYALYAVALAAFIWTGLLYVQRRVRLLVPMLVFIAALALHLSAIAVVPGLLVLAAIGLRDGERRTRAVVDIGLAFLSFTVVTVLLFVVGGHYRLDHELSRVMERTFSDTGYMFSAVHFRDFFNEQLLIGPLALLWLVPAACIALLGRQWRTPAVAFVLVTAVAQAAACWVVPDLPLGYARDWDLFAPAGVIFAAAAAVVVLGHVRSEPSRVRLLGAGLVISLFHTVPWIALNASEERSLERFKSLPLGKGRTESTVGFWYFAKGDRERATMWLNRALEADPGNVRALGHLGNMYLEEQRYDLAATVFARAVEMRPNQPRLRQGYITALFALGHYEAGLVQTDALLAMEPGKASHRAMAGLLWLGLGRVDEARQALEQAVELDPGEAAYRRALEELAAPDALQAIVARDWLAFRKE